MPWLGPALSSGDFLGSMLPRGKLTMSRLPGASSCCETTRSLRNHTHHHCTGVAGVPVLQDIRLLKL